MISKSKSKLNDWFKPNNKLELTILLSQQHLIKLIIRLKIRSLKSWVTIKHDEWIKQRLKVERKTEKQPEQIQTWIDPEKRKPRFRTLVNFQSTHKKWEERKRSKWRNNKMDRKDKRKEDLPTQINTSGCPNLNKIDANRLFLITACSLSRTSGQH